MKAKQKHDDVLAEIPEQEAENFAEQASDTSSRIQQRAYELWEQRGGGEGGELEDWLQAEAEIYGI